MLEMITAQFLNYAIIFLKDSCWCILICSIALSIHGHISYILQANCKRPNDLSLIAKKPNEFYNLSEKRLMVLKFTPKLNSTFMLQESRQ